MFVVIQNAWKNVVMIKITRVSTSKLRMTGEAPRWRLESRAWVWLSQVHGWNLSKEVLFTTCEVLTQIKTCLLVFLWTKTRNEMKTIPLIRHLLIDRWCGNCGNIVYDVRILCAAPPLVTQPICSITQYSAASTDRITKCSSPQHKTRRWRGRTSRPLQAQEPGDMCEGGKGGATTWCLSWLQQMTSCNLEGSWGIYLW